jgi:hypothetical protein
MKEGHPARIEMFIYNIGGRILPISLLITIIKRVPASGIPNRVCPECNSSAARNFFNDNKQGSEPRSVNDGKTGSAKEGCP